METKTSNPSQQGASLRTPLHLLRSLRFSNGEVCQVHDERRPPTEEERMILLLDIINETEQIFEDNADLYNPSSVGGLPQPSE
jgi:hypothetical protein